MPEQPLAIDLFCGLGGWTEGLLAEGYRVVGFDIERHDYGTGGYPGQLVLQDVLTLHGKQFKDAAVIVASPPCQKYSYMAMPWKRAKALIQWYRESPERMTELNALFDACFRIQREAIEAAGRHIPLIVENVRGAQPWVGRSNWNFASYHLWGDIPALMPIPNKNKLQGRSLNPGSGKWRPANGLGFEKSDSIKVGGQDWSNFNKTGEVSPHWRLEGLKVSGDWFGSYADMKEAGTISPGRLHGKNSVKRKAASAAIAKIPFPLARHIANAYRPVAFEATIA